MHRVVAVAACLLLGGCAAQKAQEVMSGLAGQPLDAVTARLGVPAEERLVAGRKVYVWYRSPVEERTLYKCQIRVTMNGDVVGSVAFEGDQPQCGRYADLLK